MTEPWISARADIPCCLKLRPLAFVLRGMIQTDRNPSRLPFGYPDARPVTGPCSVLLRNLSARKRGYTFEGRNRAFAASSSVRAAHSCCRPFEP